jgi:hypothetical protein
MRKATCKVRRQVADTVKPRRGEFRIIGQAFNHSVFWREREQTLS